MSPFLLLSWCFGVTEQSYNQMPVEARRGPENLEPSCHVGSGPLHAWQHWKPCRLVVTWQHRWHGNSVEEFNSAWTTDKVYGKKISQHCTTAKKMTRVYLLGTRTNSFCICCSILPENNFVLICFLMFYSQLKLFFLFFFLLFNGLWPCLKIHSKLYIFVFQ